MANLPQRPAETAVPAAADVEANSTTSKEKHYATVLVDQESEKDGLKQAECALSRQQFVAAYLV